MRSDLISQTTINHGGQTFEIDALTLVAGKSTKNIKIFNNQGQLQRVESWVYRNDSQWALTNVTRILYDSFSRVTHIYVSDDGNQSNERLHFRCAYQGLWKDYVIDYRGVKTDFIYDGLGRVIRTVQSVAVGSTIENIPSTITRSYQYDALDRVVRTSIDGQNESLASIREFDAEGYLLRAVDPHGVETTYTYSSEPGSGKRVDISIAAGTADARQVSRIYHTDGRLKSIQGDAVVPEYYSYSYDTPGTNGLLTQVDVGVEASSSVPHPRYKVTTDWFGRPTKATGTSATGTDFEKSYHYSNATGLLDHILESEVAQGGVNGNKTLRSLFQYDEFADLIRYGVDVNGFSDFGKHCPLF